MQPSVATQNVLKKLSSIFYCVFKIFMILNSILLGLSIYIMLMARNGIGTFFFIVFFINFWIMMIFFWLLSMFVKLFLCMTHDDVLNLSDDHQAWLYSIIFFPLINEENEEDFLLYVSQQSFQQDQTERTVQTPTTEHLDKMESSWKQTFEEMSSVPDTETCLICSHFYTHSYPTHQGCVKVSCCSTLLHKKCLLEWFHFNERSDQTDEEKKVISCPSCRHVFVSV